MDVEVHDTPTERARCCELAAREFDAEGDETHAAECRERAKNLIPKQKEPE